jgi:hypothetical protein|tara:strand:+ start:565 stop:804 length:240 start_codon:yes stop_codon:yes gene_type:complete
MEKIAAILIGYGMAFQYENYGSGGENIISFELSLEVTFQNGKIFVTNGPDKHEFHDTPTKRSGLLGLIDQICIDETASF